MNPEVFLPKRTPGIDHGLGSASE